VLEAEEAFPPDNIKAKKFEREEENWGGVRRTKQQLLDEEVNIQGGLQQQKSAWERPRACLCETSAK